MKQTGNTILITGGTSGLGFGLAKAFLERGNTVIITSRRKEVIDTLVSENQGLFGYAADVADFESVKKLQKVISKHHPQLNMVINSVGIMQSMNFFDSHSLLTNEIETNLVGTINIAKLFLPLLAKKKEAMLINISSGLSYVASPAHPLYSASKAGVNGLTEAIRGQADYFGYDNLHILQVAPPLISETNLEPMMHETGDKNPMNMKLEDFVRVVLKGIEKNKKIINPGPSKFLNLLGKLGSVKMKVRATQTTMATIFGSEKTSR
ncbi:SDR family oxidoreductase [Enterococcus massiliensis]|uniref:SDR family oxidoreductase n=1 Tax=Enterococcus massiliensis TaxID=1640685 RepID=UPI00065E39CB|nr:SDR family NAD(P)-dependent oxidoreductase [Enterococcus massiliensis]